jgi:hypothetical protein
MNAIRRNEALLKGTSIETSLHLNWMRNRTTASDRLANPWWCPLTADNVD